MYELNFDLVEEGKKIRRKNRENFMDKEKSVFHKNNNVCVLFLCYNSYDAFKKCYDYLKKEDNQNFDIIVSDNSTDEKNIQQFYEIGKKDKKITILKTIDNLGCSAGFSLGMEYAIQAGYKYLIMFEDDINPLNDNIITDIINNSNHINIVGPKHILLDDRGRPFHLVGYPIKILKERGVIDPRYFLKGDDTDLSLRTQKNYNNIVTINKYFYHPMRKKDFFKNRVLGYSIRNGLMLTRISDFKDIINQIRDLLLYIRYGISKWFIELNLGVIKIVFSSIYSFLIGKIGFKENSELLEKWRNTEITKPKNLRELKLKREDLNKFTKNKMFLYAILTGGQNYTAFGKIDYSTKISNGIKNGIIAGGVYDPLYPIVMLFKKIIFLEEENFQTNEITINILENTDKFRLIKILLAGIVAFIIRIPTALVVSIKILFNRIKRIIK